MLGWDSELHLLVQIRLDPVGKLSFLLEIPFSLSPSEYLCDDYSLNKLGMER